MAVSFYDRSRKRKPREQRDPGFSFTDQKSGETRSTIPGQSSNDRLNDRLRNIEKRMGGKMRHEIERLRRERERVRQRERNN